VSAGSELVGRVAPPIAGRLVMLAMRRGRPNAAGECLKATPACLPTRPCSLYFLLSRVLEPPRKAVPLRFAAESTLSPSSLAVASLLTTASPRLHLLPPELVHLTTEPESRGSRRSSSSPQRSSIAAGVGGEPAVANHRRSSLPPFSPFPRFPCELLMLTPSLGRTAMA